MTNNRKPALAGGSLARSAIWNFVGMAAPLLVGLWAIPMLIDGLGKERFGLLSIIWMGVGYFSLFDMGLGRALTKLVAEKLGKDEEYDLGPLIWTAMFLILMLGLLGTFCVGVGAFPFVYKVLNISSELQGEAVSAFRILAFGLPLVIMTTALIGILEAHQRFAIIATVRFPMGVLTFVGPLVALQFSPSLTWATAALLLARVGAFVVFFWVTASVRPELFHPLRPKSDHLRSLLNFGSWLTVTNIIGPLLSYFDRFLIGTMMSMNVVAYYVTPYDVLTRLQIISSAVLGVMFPAMTISLAEDHGRTERIYEQTSIFLFFILLPITCFFFLFAPEALDLWLGSEFKLAASPVVRWLSIGILLNALARPALTVIQSSGRPDLVAKSHLFELVPYIGLLWLLTKEFGIAGTAAAWSFRVLADTLILNEIVRRQLTELKTVVLKSYLTIGVLLLVFLGLYFIQPIIARIIALALVSILSGVVLWPKVVMLRKSMLLERVSVKGEQ